MSIEEATEILSPAFGWARRVSVKRLVETGARPTVWRFCKQRILRSEVERFRRSIKRQRIFARIMNALLFGYGIYIDSIYIGVGAMIVEAMMLIGGYQQIRVNLQSPVACLGCLLILGLIGGLVGLKLLLQ